MTPSTDEAEAVRIVREIAVPPAKVYDAFVDPEQLLRWIGPLGPQHTKLELDPRMGGRADIWMERDGGKSGSFHWEFVEMDRPRRLVMSWTFEPGEGPEDGSSSRLTIDLVEKGPELTELTLVHDRLGEISPEMRASVNEGWTRITGRLVGYLESGDTGLAA
ncbi:MAG TPA: SRPBCC domain-containing protein [Solirubrobacterales bacterium]|nr:SRPBCC domain-containing protein [Solirubrobacterales bacterium]